LFDCTAAEKAAANAFYNKFKAISESKFVSSHYPLTCGGLCETSVFKKLLELHQGLASGSIIFDKKSDGKEAPQIPTSFMQLLLPSKTSLKRWNFKARVSVLDYMLENKADLADIFKGKWGEVNKFVNKRFAREQVWTTVMERFGFAFEGKLSGEAVLSPFTGIPFIELEPKDEFLQWFPKSQEELVLMDWAKLTVGLVEYGGNQYVDEVLAGYLLNKQGVLKVVANETDTTDLLASTNGLYVSFETALKIYLFKPVNSANVQVSTFAGGDGGFAKGPHDFVSYVRFFPRLDFVTKRTPKNPMEHFDDDGEDIEAEVVTTYVRNLGACEIGPTVNVLLLVNDCFEVDTSWPDHFKDDSAKFAKKLSIGFADPPWGKNKDVNAQGGIDMESERWGRYGFVYLSFYEHIEKLEADD
jgi:hypothetical protein